MGARWRCWGMLLGGWMAVAVYSDAVYSDAVYSDAAGESAVEAEAAETSGPLEGESGTVPEPTLETDIIWVERRGDEGDLPEAVVDMLSPYHERLTRWVENTGRGIDSFFGTDEAWRVDNDSYLRLRQAFIYDERDKYNDRLRHNLRLDLPTAEDRLRFIIESAPEDDETTTDRAPGGPGGSSRVTRDNTLLGIGGGKRRDPREGWTTRNQAGVRFRWPPDPYVRTIARRTWSVGELWDINSYNRVAWFESEGFSATTRLDLDRPLAPLWRFRFITDLRWSEEDDYLEFTESLNFTQILSRRAAINYVAGFDGKSFSGPRIENYFLFLDYRRNIHKELLYINFVPGVSFPRELDFRPNWAVTFELEFYFRDEL